MPDLDASAFLADDKLTISGIASDKHSRGKKYAFPQLSWEDTLRLRRVFGDVPGNSDPDADLKALLTDADGNEITMLEKLTGSVYGQLVADGVSPTRMDRLTQLLITQYAFGEDAARFTLEAAKDEASTGEAQARANRADRRAAAKKQPASKRAAGSSSSRASGAAPRARKASTSTRGSSTSAAKKTAARKIA